jgi:hypothetical protein
MTRVSPRTRQRSLVVAFLSLASGLTSGCVGAISGKDDPGAHPGSGGGSTGAPADPNAPPPPPGPSGGQTMPGGAGASDLPGPATLRRLTPTEYNNTLRDLLGVMPGVGEDFGIDRDAALSGFARGGTVSSGADARQVLETAERLVTSAGAAIAALVPCKAPASRPMRPAARGISSPASGCERFGGPSTPTRSRVS